MTVFRNTITTIACYDNNRVPLSRLPLFWYFLRHQITPQGGGRHACGRGAAGSQGFGWTQRLDTLVAVVGDGMGWERENRWKPASLALGAQFAGVGELKDL